MSAVALAPEDTDISLLLSEFCSVVATDLRQFARLHAKELDQQQTHQLQAAGFPRGLGFKLESEEAAPVIAHLAEQVSNWPEALSQSELDELAADFAAIYLTCHYGSCPQESYWMDEDHLTMQKPMFQLREILEQQGLEVSDVHQFADDHLVNELELLAYFLEQKPDLAGLGKIADFMDEHLLRWVMSFSERVALMCESEFYAGLALITGLYCEAFRDLLAQVLDQKRPTKREIDARMNPKKVVTVPLQFIPGIQKSW